jgi:hypothetical protein
MEINLDNIFKKRAAESRSLTAENFRAKKAKAAWRRLKPACMKAPPKPGVS